MRQIPPIINGDRLGLLIRLIGNGFAQAVTTVANGLLIEFAFDELIVTTIKQEFNQTAALIGLGLATAALVTGLLRMAERADAERIGQDYTYEIRMGLYERLTSLSPRALQNRSQGGVMLRFVGDLTALRQWVSLGLARLTVSATTAIVALLILSFVSSGLALTVGVILLIGTAIAFCLGRPMQSAAKEARRRRSHLAANINEKIASVAVVQVFGQSKREKKRMDRQSRLLQDAMVTRAIITGQLRAVTESTASLAMAGALLVGAIEVAADRASPGTVVAAMTIVGLIVPSLRDLGRVQEYWHNSRVSLEKIHEFLQTPSLVKEAPNAPELKLGEGCLEFDQVSLDGVLHQFSAIAKPGKIIALVGANGAGKSTLLSLAARLLDPDQGTIYLDGQDVSQYSLASLRRAIGMASPDLPLLRGTVAKNLTYRWSAAPEEEIQRVRELCGINEVLANLPHGDQTKISEGGAGLSAGQRQRIALARALLGNPPVLLLDEVDANLDSQATAIVDRILAQHQGTIIFIAHRLERLLVADEIWYLENGRVIESGSPAKILQNDGPTARLFGNGRELELFA